MRRWMGLGMSLALVAAVTVRTVHAQNVQGITIRAGETMKGSPNGTVDIVGDGTNATMNIDLSGAAENLKLADFKDAKAFVVWAVDMDGYRHNVGTLSDELKLADAKVDFRVARAYVTAEADAAATQPSGDVLYSVTLRNVTEKESAPPAAKAAGAASSSTSGSSSSSASSSSSSASSSSTSASSAKPATTTTTKPSELPTTGGGWSDLLVLSAAAVVLFAIGLRLVGVRA